MIRSVIFSWPSTHSFSTHFQHWTSRQIRVTMLAIAALGLLMYMAMKKWGNKILKPYHLIPLPTIVNGTFKGRVTEGTNAFDIDGNFTFENSNLKGDGRIDIVSFLPLKPGDYLEGKFERGKLEKGAIFTHLLDGTRIRGEVVNGAVVSTTHENEPPHDSNAPPVHNMIIAQRKRILNELSRVYYDSLPLFTTINEFIFKGNFKGEFNGTITKN